MDDDTGIMPEADSATTPPRERIGFAVVAAAQARNTVDEPTLSDLITLADAEYLRTVAPDGRVDPDSKAVWRDAAVYEWERCLTSDADSDRLAVVATMLRYETDGMSAVIAASTLGITSDLASLRLIAAEGETAADRIVAALDDPDAFNRQAVARDVLAMTRGGGPLDAIGQNCDTATSWRVESLCSFLSLAAGGPGRRDAALAALEMDPADRYAAAVLDRTPDPATGMTGVGLPPAWPSSRGNAL